MVADSCQIPQTVNLPYLIAGVFACVYLVWGAIYPSGTWRYKLTVEVNTPEGVKTGTAVREVRAKKFRSLFNTSDIARNMTRGEAVVVDLGERGVVYALNKTYKHGIDGGYYIVGEAFPAPKNIDTPGYTHYYSNLKAGPVNLDAAVYPMFVHFRDSADPKTVEAVKPDDFAAAFGEGVSLKSVTIEMTREPVTTGVVGRYGNYCCSGQQMAITNPNMLIGGYDFVKR